MTELLDIRVPCDELAPAAVRKELRGVRGLNRTLGDALIVASELVTNAVRYSLCAADEFLSVRVSRDGRLRIAVLELHGAFREGSGKHRVAQAASGWRRSARSLGNARCRSGRHGAGDG